jgi:N-acetylglutamate synthase
VRAWPATITEATEDGWTLRATPGLDRGRSNHALTPVRALTREELAPALAHAGAFAQHHRIRLGIQVSPEHLHGELERHLDARGWEVQWPTLVMSASPGFAAPHPRRLVIEDHASATWLDAWAVCEGRRDVAAHAQTVFAGLRGRAWFARRDADSVAIAVPGDGLLGLFCIAVAPARRRAGLGREIVRGLCAQVPQATPYLQVESRNSPAIALYRDLGFAEVYRYRHRAEPASEP